MKKVFLIGVILIVIAIIIGSLVFLGEDFEKEEISEDKLYYCKQSNDCMVVREDCCGCENGGEANVLNKKYERYWNNKLDDDCEGGCPAVMSKHWTCFSEPKCIDNKCELQENCAEEGEQYSRDYEGYPRYCCEGLIEWYSGLDTSISVGEECYETDITAGVPIGTCISCGNGICEDIENACNCLEDCLNGDNSEYSNVDEFCEKGWEQFEEACEISLMKELSICHLCNDTGPLTILNVSLTDNSNLIDNSILVSIKTNKKAKCEYVGRWSAGFGGEKAGDASEFSEMDLIEMEITNRKTHSQVISGLLDDGYYTVKINCTDGYDNSTKTKFKEISLKSMEYPKEYSKYFYNIMSGGELSLLTDGTLWYDVIGFGTKNADYTSTLYRGSFGIENSTSNGDLDSPQFLMEVGTNPDNFLYKYVLSFTKNIDFSGGLENPGTMEILGRDYLVEIGSTNQKWILRESNSNSKIILEVNQSVKVDDKIINGTFVKFSGWNGEVSGIEISFAMQDSNKDYIAVGEIYDNPVFQDLRVSFYSYSEEDDERIYIGEVE